MNDQYTKPLTQIEAGRVKTMLERKNGTQVKLRELNLFSPREIAQVFNVKEYEIARWAGRKVRENVTN